MKKSRRFSVLILTILILIGVCGCNMKENSNTTKHQNPQHEIVVEMREHLRKKYGHISYKIDGLITAGWDHSYDQLNLSTTIDGVEESFFVRRYNNDGVYSFSDNYFGLVIRDEFEKFVGEYAEKYFPEFKVFAITKSNLFVYPNSLTANSTLKNMLELKGQLGNITFEVFVNETFNNVEEFNEAAKAFVSDWKILEVHSIPCVIYVSTSVYEIIERDSSLSEDDHIGYYEEIIK